MAEHQGAAGQGSPQPHITMQGISKRFGGIQALAGVDLEIAPGSIHGLVGENGAGKSTLGKIISGTLRPDAGELLVAGRPVHYATPRDAPSAIRVAYSPTGEYVAGGAHREVQVWSVGKKAMIRSFVHQDGRIEAVRFCRDGTLLYTASASPGGTVRCCDVNTGRVEVLFREAGAALITPSSVAHVYALALSPDDKTLAIGMRNGALLLDLPSRTERRALETDGRAITSLAFSPNGTFVAAAGKQIRLWSPASGEVIASLPAPTASGSISAVCVSPDSTSVVAGISGAIDEAAYVCVWGLNQTEAPVTFRCHEGPVVALHFVPGTHKIVTGSCDGALKLWDIGQL